MKMYYNRETTPLKFHKFYRFIYLPYELVLSIGTVIDLLFSVEYFSIPQATGIAFNLAVLVCIIVCMAGIGSWKVSAWKALMTYRTLYIAFTTFTLLIALLFSPKHVLAETLYFSYCLLTSGPILFYYAKRRYLFLPTQITDPKTHSTHNEIHICPTCGRVSTMDQRFCYSCGTPHYTKRRPLFFPTHLSIQPQPTDSNEFRICPTCGTGCPFDQRFCSSCGTHLLKE